MYVWSKRLAAVLLGGFALLLAIFLIQGPAESGSGLKIHTIRWMSLNYVGLLVWVFVWMIDQARVRGQQALVWLVPFLLAPLPVLMMYILYLQRRVKA